MYQPLIDAMQNYFKAGSTLDLEAMDTLYAPDFENVRIDHQGNVVTITKAQFMQSFASTKAQGQGLDSTGDVAFLTTSVYGQCGSILIRRVKKGKPVLYNFVWRLQDGNPTELVREFTVEEDLSSLMEIIRKAQSLEN